jgi:hypothetical protein
VRLVICKALAAEAPVDSAESAAPAAKLEEKLAMKKLLLICFVL